MVVENMLICFRRVKLLACIKQREELAETPKIGLRTVQDNIKNQKDSGEPTSSRKKCGRKKILNDHDL